MGWRRAAQQPMHDGALLGMVDGSAREHGVAIGLQPRFTRQLQQQGFGLGVDQVLRQVGEDVGRLLAEALEAARVGREGAAQVEAAACPLEMRLQLRPGGRAVAAGAGGKDVAAAHAAACISCSSLAASAAKARMPSASFSVAMASALSA